MLQAKIDEFKDKQADLGRQLGVAMNESSETWHDNAPAESIADEWRQLVALNTYYLELKNTAGKLKYPKPNESKIVAGSTVNFALDGRNHVYTLVNELSLYADKTGLISPLAPLGDALMGHGAGDVYQTAIAGVERTIKITDVDQVAIIRRYPIA